MVGVAGRSVQRQETLRFHERDERLLRSRLCDNIQVQRHPRVSVRCERHAADHRNTKTLFRKEPLDNVKLACEVHGKRLWHEGVACAAMLGLLL